jgi:6-phosphogluconate dehydrogenase (decarboxylating)
MTTDNPMRLGMIGLGRMGANIVRRLMRDGHTVRALIKGPAREADSAERHGRHRVGRCRP